MAISKNMAPKLRIKGTEFQNVMFEACKGPRFFYLIVGGDVRGVKLTTRDVHDIYYSLFMLSKANISIGQCKMLKLTTSQFHMLPSRFRLQSKQVTFTFINDKQHILDLIDILHITIREQFYHFSRFDHIAEKKPSSTAKNVHNIRLTPSFTLECRKVGNCDEHVISIEQNGQIILLTRSNVLHFISLIYIEENLIATYNLRSDLFMKILNTNVYQLSSEVNVVVLHDPLELLITCALNMLRLKLKSSHLG